MSVKLEEETREPTKKQLPQVKLLKYIKYTFIQEYHLTILRGRRGHDRMVDGFIIICAISAYHHLSCEFESRSLRGVLDTTLCDKVCQ
jgi:hypothetical protein